MKEIIGILIYLTCKHLELRKVVIYTLKILSDVIWDFESSFCTLTFSVISTFVNISLRVSFSLPYFSKSLKKIIHSSSSVISSHLSQLKAVLTSRVTYYFLEKPTIYNENYEYSRF